MIKNIFITGKPGSGKTTLIMEIIKALSLEAEGFYTKEIREGGRREGFKIVTLDGKEGILAHIDIKSSHRVGRYRINLKDLEDLGVRSILRGLEEKKLIVIDEIGKMELHSQKFKGAVSTALCSDSKVLGTLTLSPDPFCKKIKKRIDTQILYLTPLNRNEIKTKIIKWLESS